MNESDRMDVVSEKERYDKHDNDIKDEGYRKFLELACAPLIQYLTCNMVLVKDKGSLSGAHILSVIGAPAPRLTCILVFYKQAWTLVVDPPLHCK